MKWLKGTELRNHVKEDCLRRYVYRHTKENRPWPELPAVAVQFESDQDWLANTEFAVKKDGTLDNRCNHCMSNPTWPDNPELRR